MVNRQTQITKDLANKKIKITREFDATVEQLWTAWSTPELLEQWWAPKPFVAKTIELNFSAGGHWLYYMENPEGEKHYCRADFMSMEKNKFYEAADSFCDEKGNKNTDFPSMHWRNDFITTPTGAKVEVEISFAKIEDLHKIVEMGFEQGFTMALGNLDELLVKI